MNARETVSKMDLQEKISLLCGAGPFTVAGVARLGVPPLKMSDGPNGVKEYGAKNVCFPSASVLACSWDESLAEDVGKAIGQEAAKYGVDVLLGPGLNVKRSPLCGRNFEYFSEDAILSGMLAAAYVRGVQSRGGMCLSETFCGQQSGKATYAYERGTRRTDIARSIFEGV